MTMTRSTADHPLAGVASDLRLMGVVLHFSRGQAIYGEGDKAHSFFKVVKGMVRGCRFLPDGRRQIDCFHAAGDMFGIEAEAGYSLSAEAVDDCTVIAYRRRSFETSARTDARLSRQLLLHALHSLARSRQHALLLGRRSAVEKVAAFLIERSAYPAGTVMVLLAMTRQDIADYLGLTIETVSRTLSCLERDGLIAFAGTRRIRLCNPAALQALAS